MKALRFVWREVVGNTGKAVRWQSTRPMLRHLTEITVPATTVELAQLLDAYYIPTRYPNGFASGKPADYYNDQKVREAVNAASELIGFCKDHLD